MEDGAVGYGQKGENRKEITFPTHLELNQMGRDEGKRRGAKRVDGGGGNERPRSFELECSTKSASTSWLVLHAQAAGLRGKL